MATPLFLDLPRPSQLLLIPPPLTCLLIRTGFSHQGSPSFDGAGGVAGVRYRRWPATQGRGAGALQPPAPTDPGVTVSRHRALVILIARRWLPRPSAGTAGAGWRPPRRVSGLRPGSCPAVGTCCGSSAPSRR